MLGCSGLVLSTLSIFTATISATLNLGCFSLAFSLFGSPWLRYILFGFLLFFVIFLVGLHLVVVVNFFFHCFLPNRFLLVQIGFLCSVHLAFLCEVLFRIRLRKGRL